MGERYAVEREIGAGGMATVFLARDLRHDRQVALKVLKPELGAVVGADRFLAEIKVTAKLQHPNLVPLFDSGEANGLLYYVMPFVDGESLRSKLQRETSLSVDDTIRITTAIATALDYAHGQGVIHRDLKPENILLQSGQSMVSDFGIALALSNAGGSRITQTGLSLGTPQYMSPEQATGDRGIDRRSDIYSLAAMTYEMLTGEPPHTGTSAQAIIARVLTEKARKIRSSRPAVPEHVERTVERGLEKVAADRWATAGEFAAALTNRMATSHYATDPAGKRERARKRWQEELQNPAVILASMITLVALVALAWRTTVVDDSSDAPLQRFEIAPTREVHVSFSGASSLAISPDGQTVAIQGRLASTSRNRLFVRSMRDPDPRPVPLGEGGGGPFFSPDSKWLGYVVNQTIMRYPLGGGAPLVVARIGGIPTGITWVAPDEIVVSSGPDLLIQRPDGGERQRLDGALQGEISRQWPKSLGDGDHVLYASFVDADLSNAQLAITSLRSKKSHLLNVKGACPLGVVDDVLFYVNADQAVMAVPFDGRALRAAGQSVLLESGVLFGSSGACKASLSDGGTLVMQQIVPTARLVIRNANGANEQTILSDARAYSFPRYSPDASQIALTIWSGRRSDVWIHDIGNGTTSPLTDGGSVNERPEWSHDGKRVIFRTDRGRGSSIWWQPVDKSGPASPLIQRDGVGIFEAVMTPDGTGLVFQVDTDGADVFFRKLEGDTTWKGIAATSVAEDRARVSPDGKWVAYTNFASGKGEVVVRSIDGTGGESYVSDAGGIEPVWVRDKKLIVYRDATKFWVATWEASPNFKITSRVALFDDVFMVAGQPHANYDVSHDGSRFLLLSPVDESQIILVQNWVQELRRRR